MRFDETKDRAIQEYLETPLEYSVLVQFEARSRERLSYFYQALSHAIVLYNTQPAACIEKAVSIRSQEELYQKVRSTPRLPRVVLRANSQRGQQDQREQDARTSWDPPSESKSYRDTWNTIDYIISGILPSTVEQQDTNRQNKVKRLIEKFENHQYKESILPSGLEPDAENQQVRRI